MMIADVCEGSASTTYASSSVALSLADVTMSSHSPQIHSTSWYKNYAAFSFFVRILQIVKFLK